MTSIPARSFVVVACLVSPAVLAAQNSDFGAAIACADVDGDGFADLVVGEPLHDGAFHEEGRVLVFRGSPSGPAATPSWMQSGLQTRAHFGATLASVGDMNADGFDDLAIGAPDFDVRLRRGALGDAPIAALRDAGLVAVFLGSPSGLGAAPALFRPGIQEGEHVGAALSTAGDVDGDGFDDLLVGATGTNGGRGAVLLFAGSPAGPEKLPAWLKVGIDVDGGFGSALGGGGDVNGDGFDDVLLGARNGGPLGRGIAYLYRGSAAGLPSAPSWGISPDAGDFGFDNGISDWGAYVCIAGDLNGDGRDDLLIGNPTYDGDLGHGAGVAPDSGVVFVYCGTASGTPTYAARRESPGWTSSPVGDLDSDGRDDVVLGLGSSPFFAGQLIYGHPTFFLTRDTFVGGEHCAAGDIDGDGFDDLVAGNTATGVVSVYRGSSLGIAQLDWSLTSP